MHSPGKFNDKPIPVAPDHVADPEGHAKWSAENAALLARREAERIAAGADRDAREKGYEEARLERVKRLSEWRTADGADVVALSASAPGKIVINAPSDLDLKIVVRASRGDRIELHPIGRHEIIVHPVHAASESKGASSTESKYLRGDKPTLAARVRPHVWQVVAGLASIWAAFTWARALGWIR